MKLNFKFKILIVFLFSLLNLNSYAECSGSTDETIQCLNSNINEMATKIQKLKLSLYSIHNQSDSETDNINAISQSLISQKQLDEQANTHLKTNINNEIQVAGITGNQIINDDILTIIPIGSVMPFSADTIPNGWLLCNGKPLSKATYPQLAQVLGDKYGPNSDGNFYPPDYQGVFLRGTSGTSGRDPDAESRTALNGGTAKGNMVGSYQDDMFKSHNHGLNSQIWTWQGGEFLGGVQYHEHPIGGQGTNAAGGNETRPKNVNVNFIIYSGVYQ